MTDYYMEGNKILIVAPSLDVSQNVSGISTVTNFIIANNKKCQYEHFLQGRGDDEKGILKRIIRLWKNYMKWKTLLKRQNIKIIHYNFPLDAPSILRDFFFLRAAHCEGKHMVIHIHGGLYLFKREQPYIIKYILSKIFNWNHPFIVLSPTEHKRIKEKYHTKNVHILPNCIELAKPKTCSRNFNSVKLSLLYIGRIEPNKGMDYLYNAMEYLQNYHNNFVLYFAGTEQGGCGYIDRFKKLLGDKFIYKGIVTGKQKTELLEHCQIFLLPSLYEGLPMSLLECMSFGIVPIVTDVGSITEYVEDGENGLVIKVKDTSSIANAIMRLYNDRILSQKLSIEAQKTIRTRLNPSEYVKNLNLIYRGCTGT